MSNDADRLHQSHGIFNSNKHGEQFQEVSSNSAVVTQAAVRRLYLYLTLPNEYVVVLQPGDVLTTN